MRALQFTDFGPVSKLRLMDLPDPEGEFPGGYIAAIHATVRE
jgi:hypothetical protein